MYQEASVIVTLWRRHQDTDTVDRALFAWNKSTWMHEYVAKLLTAKV